jgi:quinol monooxygenase YgiN
MSLEITELMELTIAGDNKPAVHAMLAPIITKVKHNETGILNYQWYMSEEEGKCYSIAEFENAEAWLAHHTGLEQLIPSLFSIAPLTRWEAFGHVPPEVSEIMEPLGVVIRQPMAGFKKETK